MAAAVEAAGRIVRSLMLLQRKTAVASALAWRHQEAVARRAHLAQPQLQALMALQQTIFLVAPAVAVVVLPLLQAQREQMAAEEDLVAAAAAVAAAA